jgi:hypothetical protein
VLGEVVGLFDSVRLGAFTFVLFGYTGESRREEWMEVIYAWTNRFVAGPFESTGRSHGTLLRPALQRVLSLFLLGALANRQWCQGHCFILLWILGWEFGWVGRITGFTGLETLFFSGYALVTTSDSWGIVYIIRIHCNTFAHVLMAHSDPLTCMY